MGYKYTRVGEDFNPRAPCGARLSIASITSSGSLISTHAPLAGRDYAYILHDMDTDISTHAPLAGRDAEGAIMGTRLTTISTHAPLAGRDRKSHSISYVPPVFQPTRPLRGATVEDVPKDIYDKFQPTRPLRGATV